MTSTIPLEGYRTGTIGANGTLAILSVGPEKQRETWNVKKWSVSCTLPARFRVCRGRNTDPQYQIDTTDSGDFDTSETDVPLHSGETVSFYWFESTAGATATIRWEGTKTV